MLVLLLLRPGVPADPGQHRPRDGGGQAQAQRGHQVSERPAGRVLPEEQRADAPLAPGREHAHPLVPPKVPGLVGGGLSRGDHQQGPGHHRYCVIPIRVLIADYI